MLIENLMGTEEAALKGKSFLSLSADQSSPLRNSLQTAGRVSAWFFCTVTYVAVCAHAWTYAFRLPGFGKLYS